MDSKAKTRSLAHHNTIRSRTIRPTPTPRLCCHNCQRKKATLRCTECKVLLCKDCAVSPLFVPLSNLHQVICPDCADHNAVLIAAGYRRAEVLP